MDENVVVGATPATSGKISIVDYGKKYALYTDMIVLFLFTFSMTGSLDSISQKLLKKRFLILIIIL